MNAFGKPTTYKGITFRSRLEARWAAMFDVLGWAWEYEPECDGAYIPDFLLHGCGERRVFVEVKPLAIYLADTAKIVSKATDAIGFGEILLVLTETFPRAVGFDVSMLGFLHGIDLDDHNCDHAILFRPGLAYDFAGEFGSWEGRLTGAYDGNALFEGSMTSTGSLLKLWSRAGNAIQWKPGTPTHA